MLQLVLQPRQPLQYRLPLPALPLIFTVYNGTVDIINGSCLKRSVQKDNATNIGLGIRTDYNDWPAVFGGDIGERVLIRSNKGRRRLSQFGTHCARSSEDCWSYTQLEKVIEGISNPGLDARDVQSYV